MVGKGLYMAGTKNEADKVEMACIIIIHRHTRQSHWWNSCATTTLFGQPSLLLQVSLFHYLLAIGILCFGEVFWGQPSTSPSYLTICSFAHCLATSVCALIHFICGLFHAHLCLQNGLQ